MVILGLRICTGISKLVISLLRLAVHTRALECSIMVILGLRICTGISKLVISMLHLAAHIRAPQQYPDKKMQGKLRGRHIILSGAHKVE